jgi:hypothetical protein
MAVCAYSAEIDMTQDEIIEMAIQTGWHDALLDVSFVLPTLTDFAKLVATKAIAELESQKPVAWKLPDKDIVFWEDTKEVDEYHGFKPTIPLYTYPPQRTWVGLTADEYAELAEEYGAFPINQIEAKLKEKNT